jgi:malate/lactate dehydrogenase
MNGLHDVSDMSLSVPCVIGQRGVEQVIPLPMSEDEKGKFAEAAKTLKEVYASVKK